jgi:hypothetical protein
MGATLILREGVKTKIPLSLKGVPSKVTVLKSVVIKKSNRDSDALEFRDVKIGK